MVKAYGSLKETIDLNTLYLFLAGPGLWMTFVVSIGGLILRIVYLFGLSRERDRVFYNHMSISWAMKSIIPWLVPWGKRFIAKPADFFSCAFYLIKISSVS